MPDKNGSSTALSFTFSFPATHTFLTGSSFRLDFAGEGKENCSGGDGYVAAIDNFMAGGVEGTVKKCDCHLHLQT